MTCLMIDIDSTELSYKDEERLQNKLVGGVILKIYEENLQKNL